MLKRVSYGRSCTNVLVVPKLDAIFLLSLAFETAMRAKSANDGLKSVRSFQSYPRTP